MMSPSSLCRGRATHVALGALLTALWAPGSASAQTANEAEKPAPNVLLLVDTSGSMEFKTDGEFPACEPGNTAPTEKSRWIELVEVMTGTLNGYSCWAQDRSSAEFRSEFALEGVTPYDFGYVNPYHRALSNMCAYGPGVLPPASAPYEFPDKGVNKFEFSNGALLRPGDLSTHVGCSGFDQPEDGLLDVYNGVVRFGLMTFDARVSAGTGLLGSSADHATGVDGNWSYFLDDAPVTGHPANCDFDMTQEIGARNAAAPPWEGRMIGFGPPNAPLDDLKKRNDWIQKVLLSTRPYGATPTAGQLDDARQFLWNDTSPDPLDGTAQFGPSNDPDWLAANCRKTILVLLTDGEPNLDLRPFCEAKPPAPETPGRCPYETPEEIVSALRSSPTLPVETYVVGFALSEVQPNGEDEKIPCAKLTDAHCSDPLNNDPDANPESRNIQACCRLNSIAAAGGFEAPSKPRKAFFAQNSGELKAVFTDIFDDVVRLATRTMPVFSSPGGDPTSKGFKFFSAFDAQPDPTGPQLRAGILERTRFVCDDKLVPVPTYDPKAGDDFAANLNGETGPERRFYTVLGDGDNSNSIRPAILVDDDGLGLSTGDQVFADKPDALSSRIPPDALQVTATSCDETSSADECRDRIVNHLVGVDRLPSFPSRCSSSECYLFGAIFHSTPTVVPGRPSELLRDESYTGFVNAMDADDRPTTLYTSTVDGMLHAFNVAPFPGSATAEQDQVNNPDNNELWAFLPPAVLPALQAQYPSNPVVLLDGVPIIKDVVANAAADRFERLQSEAQAGTGNWRTVLVQGFGEGRVQGGYFALDITKPAGEGGEPKFLWQLTRDSDGGAIFGSGGTPVITTVFLEEATGGPREVAVAVLPGGGASPESGVSEPGPIMEVDPTEFKTTRKVRNYPGAEAARSLTIVRLDTGEVVRTFRPASGAALFDSSVFTETDIPAPITGQPKAFPELTGAVADRIFVGDRDGRLWRVDVSSKDPALWSMEVFYDAFEDGIDETSSQPVILPPVLSVNELGDVTVAFATGDQDLASGDTSLNRVISLTESSSGSEIVAHLNWRQDLKAGERVTGPMVLFDSALYYSVSRPPTTSTAACDVGLSKVFGVHYEDNDDVGNNRDTPSPESGPFPAPQEGPPFDASEPGLIARKPGLIFGVNLEAEVSCAKAEEVIEGNESFGYGQVKMSTEVKPGRYFLSYGASGNTSDATSRGVLEVRQELPNPRLAVTFESWATVYE